MSVLSTIVAAAGEAAPPSQVPFYAAGAALAAWGVLVGLVGILRPSFAGNATAARLAMLVGAVLVAGAASSAILTS